MNFNEIKQLINSNGEKIILVEDGKPTLVLMSFEDYRKISQGSEKGEKEKEEIEKNPVLEEQRKNDLTLDDLPF
jgi:PHD/YefM family antitoxin component YafN of YafNO toxin-antitoxin module